MSNIADYVVVPGTVYIIDNRRTTPGAETSVLLVPTPTEDLKDPLRWSRWRKAWHLTILVAYAALSGALVNWQNPFFLLLVADTGSNLTTINRGVSTSLLMTGFGNVIFTPLSHSKNSKLRLSHYQALSSPRIRKAIRVPHELGSRFREHSLDGECTIWSRIHRSLRIARTWDRPLRSNGRCIHR